MHIAKLLSRKFTLPPAAYGHFHGILIIYFLHFQLQKDVPV